MPWLLILFIVVPAVELTLLIEVGERIGAGPTFALVVLTGVVGASLARSQGLGVLRRLQSEMAGAGGPGAAIVEAFLVLVAGVVLVTPGFLTDALGLALLLPFVRTAIAAGLARHVLRPGAGGVVHGFGSSGPRPGPPVTGGGLKDLPPDAYDVRDPSDETSSDPA